MNILINQPHLSTVAVLVVAIIRKVLSLSPRLSPSCTTNQPSLSPLVVNFITYLTPLSLERVEKTIDPLTSHQSLSRLRLSLIDSIHPHP